MKDKIPPKITPVPNCRDTKMKPAKLPITIITAIVHKIRRCEIGGAVDGSIWMLSESSLIAKHKFYKLKGKKAKGLKTEKGKKTKMLKINNFDSLDQKVLLKPFFAFPLFRFFTFSLYNCLL